MNILLIGSGGREHAIAWKLSQSPLLTKLYIAPGNAGTEMCGVNVSISETDFESIKKFVIDHNVNMVIVGPEAPLVKGIHDYFLNDAVLKNIPVIGPQKLGAQLEGSKDFSKQFMQRHNIPTAQYKTFTASCLQDGINFLKTLSPPFVLKADGLAAGKGVVIPNTLKEAEEELTDMLANARFGEASSRVVIEEFLHGIELSVFVLTDGNSYKILPEAKDYKRIGVNDTGLNTGGMGAISPVPFAGKDFMKKVEERVVKPTIDGLKKDNIPYKGFIFIGLMNVSGNPFVIEYNCRMGDPETEVVMPRIKSDLIEIFKGVAEGNLDKKNLDISEETAATVMLVSGGYPGDYEKGKTISGTENCKNSLIFHAGTKKKDNQILTNGGRVIAITSLGNSIEEATNYSIKNASIINFDKKYFRNDIGKDLIKLQTS